MTDLHAAAPIETVAAAPVITEAPVAAEPVQATTVAQTIEAPAPESPQPSAEAPAAEAPQYEQKTSLLESAKVGEPEAGVDDKPIEVAPAEGEVKPEGEVVPVEPVALPEIKYEFKLPEGVTPEAEKMETFTKVLGENRVPPELGQKFLDLHVAEVGQLANRIQKANWDNWTKMQDQWVSEFNADREIGGNRVKTTLNTCAAVIEQYGGSPEQQAQLRKVFTDTGAGNHPLVIRLLNNIGKVLSEGRPVAAPKPPPQAQSRQARRYGST